MNARWLPMGLAVGPFLKGGPLRRALESIAIVDASFAIASNGDGTYDRERLIGATHPAGQRVDRWAPRSGVLGGSLLGDPQALGLDAMFPAFFAVLLFEEARGTAAITAAALGAADRARCCCRGRPAGIPVVVAAARRADRPAPALRAPAGGDGMTAVWITIAVLAVGTFASKAVGTLVLGGRDLSPRTLNVTALVAPAILAALVVYETLGGRRRRHRRRRPRRRARRRDPRDPRQGPDDRRDPRRRRRDRGLARV